MTMHTQVAIMCCYRWRSAWKCPLTLVLVTEDMVIAGGTKCSYGPRWWHMACLESSLVARGVPVVITGGTWHAWSHRRQHVVCLWSSLVAHCMPGVIAGGT